MMNSKYYWFDTENANLHCGEYDDNGLENRDTDEIILRDIYECAGVNPNPEDDEEREESWAKIDAYIRKRLGFLPEYELN